MDFVVSKSAASWQGKLAILAAFLAGIGIPVSLALENIAAGLLVLVALLTPALWRELPRICRQPFVLACLLFYGLFVLGASWSPESWARIGAMLTKLRAYLCVPLLFAVFLWLPVRRAFFWGLATGAVASLLLSFGMAASGLPFWQGAPGDWAVFHSHTYHNYYLTQLVFALLALWLGGGLSGRGRWLAGGLLLLCVIDVLFLVKGRTGQALFLLLLALIPLLWRGRQGLLIAALGLLAAIPGAFWASSAVRDGIRQAQVEAVQFQQDARQETSIGLRLNFYQAAAQIISEKPLLGHGTGTVDREYRRLAAQDPQVLATRNPHNDYLWAAIEVGALGPLALLGMLGALVWQARQRARPERWMAIGLAVSMAVATLANSFFMDNITGLGFVLTACALLAGDSFAPAVQSRKPSA